MCRIDSRNSFALLYSSAAIRRADYRHAAPEASRGNVDGGPIIWCASQRCESRLIVRTESAAMRQVDAFVGEFVKEQGMEADEARAS